MVATPLSQYSLAIMPSPEIADMVRELKQALRVEIGRSYGSANADAHISLDGFEADEENYPVILAEYQKIVSTLSPFEIIFSGFCDFDRGNYSAFYIDMIMESANEIRERTGKIKSTFDKKLKKQFMIKWADESKNPHMSIGRRMTREWVDLAYTLFPDFEQTFLCQAFAIRKFNEKKRQYEVIDLIPLLAPVEGQLDIF